jgi:ferritin-like metal-binding protein YciE
MAKLETLKDLFVEDLRDLHSAENLLLLALKKWGDAASTQELRAAFREHRDQTEGHIKRLDKIFDELKEKPTGKTCKAMVGLVTEGYQIDNEKAKPAIKDSGLIAAAQRAEHYEIASYGTVRTYAQHLKMTPEAGLLEETLNEEKETDKTLTELAEKLLNMLEP